MQSIPWERCPVCGATLIIDQSDINPMTAYVYACNLVLDYDGEVVYMPHSDSDVAAPQHALQHA